VPAGTLTVMESEWVTDGQTTGLIPERPVAENSTDQPEPPAAETIEPSASESTVDAIDHVLGQVEQALVRLDEGTYGRCATCGASIDDARLVEEPTTQACAGCVSAPVA
jgi:DnaK suppressor protein